MRTVKGLLSMEPITGSDCSGKSEISKYFLHHNVKTYLLRDVVEPGAGLQGIEATESTADQLELGCVDHDALLARHPQQIENETGVGSIDCKGFARDVHPLRNDVAVDHEVETNAKVRAANNCEILISVDNAISDVVGGGRDDVV